MRAFAIGLKGTDEYTSTIYAPTAGKAKFERLSSMQDAGYQIGFKDLTCRALGNRPTPAELLQRECDAFNAKHPIGTRVRYWSGAREGEPSGVGEISHTATVRDRTIAVWINGACGYHSHTHVEACAFAAPSARAGIPASIDGEVR